MREVVVMTKQGSHVYENVDIQVNPLGILFISRNGEAVAAFASGSWEYYDNRIL